jgi:hypothetical protein
MVAFSCCLIRRLGHSVLKPMLEKNGLYPILASGSQNRSTVLGRITGKPEVNFSIAHDWGSKSGGLSNIFSIALSSVLGQVR